MHQLRGIELKRFLRKIKKPHIDVYLIVENVEYATNVASIFRTAEAMAVTKIFLTGVSKTPPFGKDLKKASRNKEEKVYWEYANDSAEVILKLKNRGFQAIALEITDESTIISECEFGDKVVVVVGSEVFGLKQSTLDKCDKSVYIPMHGKGSSLNVGVATGIILNDIINSYNAKNKN